MRTWKEDAHHHIAKVVRENPGVTEEKALRKLISAAYPFGERRMYPYKAWCQAVKEFFAERKHYGTAADYIGMPLFEVAA